MPLEVGLWTTSNSVLIVIRKYLSWACLLSNQHLDFSKEELYNYRIDCSALSDYTNWDKWKGKLIDLV